MSSDSVKSLAERKKIRHEDNLAHARKKLAESGKPNIDLGLLADEIVAWGNPRPSISYLEVLFMSYAASPEHVTDVQTFMEYIAQLDREGGN